MVNAGTEGAYYVFCRTGSERKVAERIVKALGRCCKLAAEAVATPFRGYVRVKVVAGEGAVAQETELELPKDARMVIELVPGTIRVLGKGNE
jgi:predicted membrane-bound mannosyltransferase